MFPLSKPIIATIVVFASVGQWNSFYDNLFLVHKQSLMTLQMLLYQYLNEVDSLASSLRMGGASTAAAAAGAFTLSPTGVRMTITIIVILPILVVYPFMQKYFIKGIMLGAIKG
jgi:putative aldouronate transport system permease protein